MNTNSPELLDENLDGLLSQFYKAQVPAPFPPLRAFELPMPIRKPLGRSHAVRSKLSLAASITLLIGGCWYLSGVVGKPNEKLNVGKGGSASVPEVLKIKDTGKLSGR